MLRLDKVIKPWKESAALNAHINLYGFWNQTAFLTKSGDVGMILSVPGVDYESLDRAEQTYAVKRLEAALKVFGPGFHVYQYLFKSNRPDIPFATYDDPVVEAAIDQRRKFFEAKRGHPYRIDSRDGRSGKTMKLEEVNKRTKEAVDFLVAALESGHSEVLTAYLGAMAKFHTYSFGNIMLIARQKPDATNVAGLRTWNSLGRFVKRGEKGIFILAPMIGKKRQEEEATGEEDKKSNGEARLYGFRAVYVFDISQTEGKELPTLTEVDGDVSGYRERLFKFVESQSVELSFSERIAPAKGLSHGGKITLLSGMQPAEEFSTLVHEIAHEMLHRGDRRTLTTKQVRETEAEAVAFVVCQSVGLHNGTASRDYIQIWHGDANLLRESLEAVQQTAAVILGGIAPEPAALAAAA